MEIETKDKTIEPGNYLFRPNPFVPWIKVQIYKESVIKPQEYRARMAGIEIDALKLINRGQWKSFV